MIDRYLLRYFLAVVDHGNFSRAAAQCNVSQPTLSVGIAKLERSVEAMLFHRSNQRVQLTEAGTRFLTHARRIEREFNLAHQAMSGSAPETVLRLGMLQSVAGSLIASAFAASGMRGAQVEIVTGNERELLGQLSRGRLDISLTLLRPGGGRFLEEPLVEEGYGIVLPKAHALAGRAQLAAEELANETMIVRRHCDALSETSRHFLERGVRPHFALRSTNDERVVQMVAAGLGITVMPCSYATAGISWVPLAGFDLRRTIGFQYGPDSEHARDAAHPLMDAVRSLMRTIST